jgi:hypothetical protein
LSEFFSVLSGVVIAAVPIIYLRQVVKGISIPNPATWFICLMTFGLNTATYFFVVEKNIWKILLPSTILLGIIVVFGYSFIKGKFARIGIVEIVSVLLAIGIGILWKTTKDATLANLALQVVLMISFLPMIVGLLRRTLREGPLPWSLGVLSYIFLIVAIVLDWQGNWAELAYPFFNGILGNGSIAVISYVQNSKIKKVLI